MKKAIAEPSDAAGTPAQQTPGDLDVARQPGERHSWPIDRPIPTTVFDHQLAAMLGLGLAQFYKRKAAGDFDFLRQVPQLPNSNTRYSGVLVARWLDGGRDVAAPTSRAFFPNARSIHAAKRRGPGRPRTTPKSREAR